MNAVDTNVLIYRLDRQEAGVTTLYTEDMGAPAAYDGIQLVNLFT